MSDYLKRRERERKLEKIRGKRRKTVTEGTTRAPAYYRSAEGRVVIHPAEAQRVVDYHRAEVERAKAGEFDHLELTAGLTSPSHLAGRLRTHRRILKRKEAILDFINEGGGELPAKLRPKSAD